jgi:hypothetical protein
MSEPRHLPNQPADDGPAALNPWIALEIGDDGGAAFHQWIAREIARARVARLDAIGAFVRQAAPAGTDRVSSPIRSATRAMMRWAMSMTPRSRRI